MDFTNAQHDVYVAVNKAMVDDATIHEMLVAMCEAISDVTILPKDVAAYIMERWADDYKKQLLGQWTRGEH